MDEGMTPAPAARVDELLSALEALDAGNSHLTGRFADSLGIGGTDLRALVFVARAGGEATPKRTAEFLELSTGATTSVLDRVAAAGLIARAPHPTDRRSIRLVLSPAGAEAIERIYGTYLEALHEAVEPADVPRVAAAFRAIGEALVRRAGGQPSA